jgi:hypothetical protein
MKAPNATSPATGKKFPPKSAELEAINCALDANPVMAESTTASTGIIFMDEVRANAGVETVNKEGKDARRVRINSQSKQASKGRMEAKRWWRVVTCRQAAGGRDCWRHGVTASVDLSFSTSLATSSTRIHLTFNSPAWLAGLTKAEHAATRRARKKRIRAMVKLMMKF